MIIEATNLVELTGTPKQIAWAEDIRKAYIEKLNEKFEFAESKYESFAFVKFSFYANEAKDAIKMTRPLDSSVEKKAYLKVFPEIEKPRAANREYCRIEDEVYQLSMSDDADAIDKIKLAYKPFILYKLRISEAKYWIENYKHLTYKR